MTNTHFENACGLDAPGHLSSARDVAIMSREMLLHHAEVADYCTIWTDTLRGGETQLVNTNKLLQRYNGITGLKTGTTGQAGVCISASAERDGLRLIAVVLGAASGQERFEAATALLDYGFAYFENVQAPLPQDAPRQIAVTHGMETAIDLEYTTPGQYLMYRGQNASLRTEIELPQNLAAPVKAGQQVGTVKVLCEEEEVDSCPILASGDVAARSFAGCFCRLAEALRPECENFVQNIGSEGR